MATASELLARTATPETEPHIVVEKTREVVVPDELRNIAVQYDHNIETVVFDCPRYWDEHDLSTMQVFINYMRADNEIDQYPCSDITIDETDESIMHFSWTISGHVTEVIGTVSFLVCVKSTDENGYLKNRWSSFLNQQMTVKTGMIASSKIVDLQPDVITSMLLRLDNAEDVLESVTATLENVKKSMLPAGILYGDVNGDGVINIKDSQLITRYLNGEITKDQLSLAAADVNGDGVVDATDGDLISQYAAGFITEFEAGTCAYWQTDGEYYYYDLTATGITEDMSVTVTAPGVTIVKTECMQDIIRVYVAVPPIEDTPYFIHHDIDWDRTPGTLGSVKKRPLYLGNSSIACGTFSGEADEVLYVSNLTPSPATLVDGKLKISLDGEEREWPVIGYYTTFNEAKRAISTYGSPDCVVVLRGDALSLDPLNYYLYTGRVSTYLMSVINNSETDAPGVYAYCKHANNSIFCPVELTILAVQVDPRYEDFFDGITDNIEVDTTLTKSGKAADAKAVGDLIGDINAILDAINGEVI